MAPVTSDFYGKREKTCPDCCLVCRTILSSMFLFYSQSKSKDKHTLELINVKKGQQYHKTVTYSCPPRLSSRGLSEFKFLFGCIQTVSHVSLRTVGLMRALHPSVGFFPLLCMCVNRRQRQSVKEGPACAWRVNQDMSVSTACCFRCQKNVLIRWTELSCSSHQRMHLS